MRQAEGGYIWIRKKDAVPAFITNMKKMMMSEYAQIAQAIITRTGLMKTISAVNGSLITGVTDNAEENKARILEIPLLYVPEWE